VLTKRNDLRADFEIAGGSVPGRAIRWLGALRGKVAAQGMLLAATDAGVTRIEVERGALRKTRDFPDTEPFVDSGQQLLAGRDGLYLASRREIAALTMN
jgi:hypothetical protein